jgi:hypothetical protein
MKNLIITSVCFLCIQFAFAQLRPNTRIGSNTIKPSAIIKMKTSDYQLPRAVISAEKLNVSKDLVRVSGNTRSTFDNKIVRSKTTEDDEKICKTDYRKLDVTNLSQDVLNPDDIAGLRLGGIYDFNEFKNGNGKPDFFPEKRNPLSMNITGIKSVTINEPDANTLADGLTQLLNTPFPVRPAGAGQYYECKTVNSKSELEIAAGLSYYGGSFSATTALNYNEHSTKNKFLVTYLYPVFTAQISSGKNYFANSELNSNPNLVVIDRISYGAKLLIYFESELDEKTMKATFSGSGWGAKANLSDEVKKQLNNTVYRVFLYGSNKPIEVVEHYDELFPKTQAMINAICDDSKKIPLQLGAPISYSLRFMNGDVAATNCNANELPSQVCTPNPKNKLMDLSVSLQSLKFSGGNNFGWIDFEILDGTPEHNRRGDDIKTVWNVNRDNATYQDVGTPNNPVTSIFFKDINAKDRANGSLRVWTRLQNRKIGGTDAFLVKLDNPKFDEGYNGMHGKFFGQFYDIPLSKILNTKPGEKYKETLIRKAGNDKEMDIEIQAVFH